MLPNPLLSAILSVLIASQLPLFEDFREADRERRQTGQLVTARHLALMRVDQELIRQAAAREPNDVQIQWGAAELLSKWEERRALFESALAAGGTNTAVALRFACAAALSRDDAAAEKWLNHCKRADPANLAPWITEAWLHWRQAKKPERFEAPATATRFVDYGAETGVARIRALDAAGYSPYSARRLGFVQHPTVALLLRELASSPQSEPLASALLTAARSLQKTSKFLITELMAQNAERMMLTARPDARTNEEIINRVEELDARRDELQELVSAIERGVIDVATEAEMIQYFDEVLVIGEEAAMKRLAQSVRAHPVE